MAIPSLPPVARWPKVQPDPPLMTGMMYVQRSGGWHRCSTVPLPQSHTGGNLLSHPGSSAGHGNSSLAGTHRVNLEGRWEGKRMEDECGVLVLVAGQSSNFTSFALGLQSPLVDHLPSLLVDIKSQISPSKCLKHHYCSEMHGLVQVDSIYI